ncbi:MAG: bifunctional transaldolase/phosoglucose isomerase [Ignavibacteriaceae bacterium]
MKSKLKELEKYGQSVWLDNISREKIKKGELKKLIDEIGLKGVTSNPSIFQKAIGGGNDYDDQIKSLLLKNNDLSAPEIFEQLAVKDIQDACDVLYPVFEKANGNDGFVSIEVSPELAYDTQATIEEARRLFSSVNRPNVMVKIPATQEGIPAIKRMISEGVNINITLIFSPDVYEQVVEAYISGLEVRVKRNDSIKQIASVASFFISRIDTMVDKELGEKGNKDLQGKIAIANAKLVYKRCKELFSSERFKKLEEKGAKKQRLLWASTSTKNPDYPDTLYVDELIGKDTVNTLPDETIEAFEDHGEVKGETIEKNVDEAKKQMDKLKKVPIDFTEITDKLTKEGVDKFSDSFQKLMKEIEKKKQNILSEGPRAQKIKLPKKFEDLVNKRLQKWEKENLLVRMWDCDPTVWKENKEDDVELSDKLGWLILPSCMEEELDDLQKFSDEVKGKFKSVVLLGMGGSSLAPEMFFKTFGNTSGHPDLTVLDSTHPEAVKKVLDTHDLKKTIFIVASKSGGTTETMSFFYTFFNEVSKNNSNPGEQFIAITDKGTSLEKLAEEKKFKKTFTTPDEVGGRYSALTFFGLVPASLIGVDISKLLSRAREETIKSSKNVKVSNSPGCHLGAAIGELAKAGKDKLTIFASPKISAFPTWVEQLIAESTGKEGKGILPVADEPAGSIDAYGDDRVFAYLRLNDDDNSKLDELISKLGKADFPIIKIDLKDKYDIGKEFFRWEVATALSGAVLDINPFNQPNVQLAKNLANESMKEYKEKGKLPSEKPIIKNGEISVFGKSGKNNVEEALKDFLSQGKEGSYVAVMAFIPPNKKTDEALESFRKSIRDKYKFAVTAGYGPHFLHSTGQLHKGDGNKGLFIQFTSEIKNDMEVPGKGYSFGTLITAQAQGDMKALLNSDRRVIRFNFDGNIAENIKKIESSLK